MKQITAFVIAFGFFLAYVIYLAIGVRECVNRGGVPVLLPTGTQCAGKLPAPTTPD